MAKVTASPFASVAVSVPDKSVSSFVEKDAVLRTGAAFELPPPPPPPPPQPEAINAMTAAATNGALTLFSDGVACSESAIQRVILIAQILP